MVRRIAAVMALLAFAVCLVAGIAADNPPATTLYRSLVAMAGTLAVGLVVGAMAQRMLDENVEMRKRAGSPAANPENSGNPSAPKDR